MIICIPTEDSNGLGSKVYGHFGSAPFFVLYDLANGEIETINNMDKRHEHGQCNPLLSFEEKPFDIMVTGGIGMRALQRLQTAGITVYRIEMEKSVKDVIESIEKNALKEITVQESCNHSKGHGCH